MITDKRYTEQRKLFGEAISKDPVEVALLHRYAQPLSLGNEITKHIIGCAIESGTDEEIEARFQLREGIRELYSFYECILQDRIPPEERSRIAGHPRTARRLIELALHTDEDAVVATGDYGYTLNNYVLSEDEKYITVARLALTVPEKGCPFAGNNASQKVDPLFRRFTEWGTTLIFAHHEAQAVDMVSAQDDHAAVKS